ncbi:hypothetical protein [Mucilaginibacter paludis]|uniref:IPT/TIG domain-containing protein n=1 Tax=Mucilaginibacter paludis DSM 18603 TaxID=714943 RepID=H1Y6I1_9SPHI|nr:hypothetical protein [Mucilaginibacter paludis]EHQ25825.1 hypothetical protein Mucpa_1668 [Mucilaginibacter paludis DSM 18603]
MKILKKATFLLFATVLLASSCTSPTQDIKIVIDTNVIKYSSLIHITDAADPSVTPAGIVLTITGQDADKIYEISGKKNFTVSGGIITIGVAPSTTPTVDKPVKINVNITAPGYTPVTQAIEFNPGVMQQVNNINLLKIGSPPVVTPPVVTPPTPVVLTPITFNFIGICVNKSNFELRPSIYIFYRETGSATAFQYLGYMDKGQITASLVMGKKYDFEMTYASVNYIVTETIAQTAYTEKVTLGDICNSF